MNRITLYFFLFSFFINTHFYAQNKVSYNNENNETLDFTYPDDEFYVTFDSSLTLRINSVVKEIYPISKNTAVIKVPKNITDIDALKRELNTYYNNSIKNIDITLRRDNRKFLSSKEILITVKNGVSIDGLVRSLNINKEYVLKKHDLINNLNILFIDDFNTQELFDLTSKLNKVADVIYAEPNLIREIVIHNDPYLDLQWSIENKGLWNGRPKPNMDMNVKPAWEIATGTGVKIAVLDDGVELNHPDLAANMITGYDATGGGGGGVNAPGDLHGTSCAGIIAAVKNNIGIRGIAYNSKIMPIKIYTKNNWGGNTTTASIVASGFIWAKNNGAAIISNSWEAPSLNSPTLNNAIADCVDNGRSGKGCVVLFSTGNNFSNTISYPASLQNVIAVGASDMCDNRKSVLSCDNDTSWGSNYGEGISFIAPGTEIYTTNIGGGYWYFKGTSAACPNAAGVAALVLSVNPNFTQSQIRNIMEGSAEKVHSDSYNYQTQPNYPNGTWNQYVGYGRVNAYRAVYTAQCITNPSPNLDLFIKDCVADVGNEPSGCPEFWDSPDIWIRNDMGTSSEAQNPIYRSNGQPNYIHVRIRNRSCIPSTGNESLKIYWSKANTSYTWPEYWDGTVKNSNGYPLSGGLNSVIIPVIEPGGDVVVIVPWVVPNPSLYSNMDEPWHYCLMARIESNDDTIHPEIADSGANIRNNNNIAQKNVSVINPVPGNPIGAIVGVGNAFPVHKDFVFEFRVKPSEIGKLIYEEAEVTIKLDGGLLQKVTDAGTSLTNMRRISEDTFLITGDNASLGNLHFEPNEIDLLTLKFNFLTPEITDKEKYTYYVVQKDLDGNIVGGETYEIRKKIERDLFYAEIGGNTEVNKDEITLLSAQSINEPALYNWYDLEGNLIYEGIDLVTSVAAGKKYKLEVIALADGYKDYSEVELTLKPNVIETIFPNPAHDFLTVDYKINKGSSAYLSVTGINVPNVSNNYIIDVENGEIILNVNNFHTGVYVIALIIDGNIADSKNFIKQ